MVVVELDVVVVAVVVVVVVVVVVCGANAFTIDHNRWKDLTFLDLHLFADFHFGWRDIFNDGDVQPLIPHAITCKSSIL